MPGLAERIVKMAETSATGDMKTRKMLAKAEIDQGKAGLGAAFALTLIAMIAAIVFFIMEMPWAGLAFLAFPVTMLIRSFMRDS